MLRSRDPARLEACFRTLVAAAVAGRRCPENGQEGVSSDLTTALARAGRIRVEISTRNYRRIVILTGEHSGKATAADPTGGQPWKIIGKSTIINGKLHVSKHARSQPSAPRLLTADELRSIK